MNNKPKILAHLTVRLPASAEAKAAECWKVLDEEHQDAFGTPLTQSKLLLAALTALYKKLKDEGRI